MKLKDKLALDWFGLDQSSDLKCAYLAGFEKAREMASRNLSGMADWTIEGVNSDDISFQDCRREERLLRYHARKILELGEEEVSDKPPEDQL